MKRLKPHEIKPGHSYRLMPTYIAIPGKKIIRKVEEIRGDKVVVKVRGEMKEFPLKVFADLAVEEVS